MAGYEMKEFLIGYLGAKGYDVYDFGTDSPEAVDYADFAHPLAEAIEKGEFEHGIALCGSGEGMAITLNKHQRIRAGLVWRKEIAELVKKHNNANVIVLPGTLHHQRRSGGVHRDLPHYRVRGRPSRTPHRQDSRQGPRIDRPARASSLLRYGTRCETDAAARPLQPLPVEKYPVERRGIVLRPHGIVEQSEKSRAAADIAA